MHITLNKNFKIIFAPLIKLTEWMGSNWPVTLVKIRYFVRFRKFINLKNPKDLNEKILYLKLFSDTSLWTLCADKYKVRDYVKSCGLEDALVKLYGVWYHAEDFHLSDLPESFILKANNGDGKGSNFIVKNKKIFKEDELRKIIKEWLNNKNIGALSSEPHYKGMIPCVIAEELLPLDEGSKSLVDYKIWCFNGKPYYIWACSDRDNYGTDVMTYDLNWNPMPEACVFDSRYRKGRIITKPKNINKMLEIAEILAKPFPQVRIDLYNINGKVYFGETTFTSLGGMMNFYSTEFLLNMGSLVDLNYK
jgi:ferredoxin-fold anticodon binding domain-containing protein